MFFNLILCDRPKIGGNLIQDILQILLTISEVLCFLVATIDLVNSATLCLQAASYLLCDQLDQLCG